MFDHTFIVHYWKTTINATLIEVYEGSHTSDKQMFLITINFKPEWQVILSLFSSNDRPTIFLPNFSRSRLKAICVILSTIIDLLHGGLFTLQEIRKHTLKGDIANKCYHVSKKMFPFHFWFLHSVQEAGIRAHLH